MYNKKIIISNENLLTEYNKYIIFSKKWPTAEVKGRSGKPFGAVVHWRERRTTNPLIGGSNPLGPTFVLRLLKLFLNVNHFYSMPNRSSNAITMRMSIRRFTHLTNAFPKKVENLAHAVSLHFMYYNFAEYIKS